MPQWLAHHLQWITLASIVCTVVLSGLGGLIIVLLPADYFDRRKRASPVAGGRRSVFGFLLRVLKNIAGVFFIFLGVILAVPGVPGPGLLFILLGVSMVDLPGKFALERRLIGNRMVLKSINLVRARLKRPPMTFSHELPASAAASPLPGETAR